MSTEPNPSPADPGGQPSCLSWFMPVGLALEVVRGLTEARNERRCLAS